MRQLLTVIIGLFSSLMLYAQNDGYWSKSDLTISSLTLTPHVGANEPGTIVLPKNNNGQTISTSGNTKRDSTLFATKQPVKEIPNFFRCTIIVKNNNIHTALDAKLIVVLPPHVNAQASAPNVIMHKYDPTSPFTASVEFKLGDMTPNQTKTLEVFFRKSVTSQVHRVTAFVFSNTVDTDPGNNYKDTTF